MRAYSSTEKVPRFLKNRTKRSLGFKNGSTKTEINFYTTRSKKLMKLEIISHQSSTNLIAVNLLSTKAILIRPGNTRTKVQVSKPSVIAKNSRPITQTKKIRYTPYLSRFLAIMNQTYRNQVLSKKVT
jgi:hypothetical protein